MLVTEMPERGRASRRISLVKRRTPAVSPRSPALRRRCDLVDLVPDLPEPDRQLGHRCTAAPPLRWVATTDIACRLPWTGSWTGASDNPSAASAISAITRVICAGSAPGARGRTSHNPPVVGSSSTRPTSSFDIRSAMAVDRCRWCDSSCRYAVRSHRVAVEWVWRAKAYGGKDWTGCLPGSPRACGTEQCVLPPAG